MRGSRVVVRLSELTVARAAYRIASRAVHDWGADTVRAVTTKVRLATEAVVSGAFVEQLLTGLTAFRWLERARVELDGGLMEAKTALEFQFLHDDPRVLREISPPIIVDIGALLTIGARQQRQAPLGG